MVIGATEQRGRLPWAAAAGKARPRRDTRHPDDSTSPVHRARLPRPRVRLRRRTAEGRKLKVTVAVVLLIAAVGALALAGWALVRTKSYTVPDLVGIQEEVALNEISGNDWTVERNLERSDEFPKQEP